MKISKKQPKSQTDRPPRKGDVTILPSGTIKTVLRGSSDPSKVLYSLRSPKVGSSSAGAVAQAPANPGLSGRTGDEKDQYEFAETVPYRL